MYMYNVMWILFIGHAGIVQSFLFVHTPIYSTVDKYTRHCIIIIVT